MVNRNSLRLEIDLIKHPLITEKSASLFEKNQYTFIVDKTMNKLKIKTTIEFLFNVKVIKVNTCLVKRKKKRLGKYIGYTNLQKKAIVKLATGNNINLFEET
jgi:large subunit ribosomal protein L23